MPDLLCCFHSKRLNISSVANVALNKNDGKYKQHKTVMKEQIHLDGNLALPPTPWAITEKLTQSSNTAKTQAHMWTFVLYKRRVMTHCSTSSTTNNNKATHKHIALPSK